MNIKQNHSLENLNTFGLDARTKYFIECNSIEDVQKAMGDGAVTNENLLILGGGSNILLTRDLDGWVLKMNILGQEILAEDDESVLIRVGAGENWHEFVMDAIDNNWGGIENLSLIPGTVGAAPMQNIGAYGVEIEQVFDHLRAVNRDTGETHTFYKDECAFGYRESIFKTTHKDQYIICDVAFRLKKPPHSLNTSYGAIRQVLDEKNISNPSIRDVSEAVIEIRQSKLPDPAEIGNSGSFFKNPTVTSSRYRDLQTEYPEIPGYKLENGNVKIPAAWLIEQCGWKGHIRNNIGVHKNQALVLVNYGGGKGSDIEQLAKEIQESVTQQFGIQLKPEVNII
ncbi:MAG: UDP-N-acetylmuramate dehydrogenase [Cyclobacteriaceae bacterium]